MDLRPLGETGILVSPLGLGTVKLGRTEDVKYPDAFEIPGDERARELLALAADLGVNLIDTAPAYGTSEERLGVLLEGHRDGWVLCTKVGEEFEGGVSRFDFSFKHTIASVERSLRRLRTDYLDVVLVHSDGNDLDILTTTGVMDGLNRLKEQGKIRATGFSPKTLEGALEAIEADVLMLTLNPRDTEQIPAIESAEVCGRGVLIKKGLLSGHFGEAGRGEPNGQPGDDPVEHCLRFIFRNPGVSSVVVGTINPDHLRQNAETLARVLGTG